MATGDGQPMWLSSTYPLYCHTLHYSATTKDLQKLADIVANSALTVPKSILTIAKRAIRLRKAVTSWFLGQGDSTNNKRHAHFITTLEQICETLEWKTNQSSKPDVKQPVPTSKAQGDDGDTERFLNKFAVLTIVKVTVVEEDDNEAADSYLGHLFFKTLCLLQDLNNIRMFISITWSEYRDKKIDLMNAAVVTDSALQLTRDLVEEVEADWRTSLTGKRDHVQNIVYNLAVSTRGISAAPSIEIGLPYNKNMADIADWCYLPTKVLLESFANVLQDNNQPVFKNGYFGSYNPAADRERMSLSQKFNEDKIILLSILPEFCMVDTFKIQMPTEDAITRGLVEFAKTKRVTLWLCFASQIFLDVHHVMRYSTMGGAFGDLRMSGLRIQKTIDDFLQLSKTHPQPKFWPKEGDEEIRNISSTVKSWIIQDLFLDIRVFSGLDKIGSTPEKHALFSQHSILCGLILFNLNTRMQLVGQQLVTQWYDVQQLAFLHNLAINSPTHKDLRWPDMGAFVKIHGESHIFIATGISSAANFARNSRKKGFHTPDGKNSRVRKPTTEIANLFFAYYVDGSEQDAGFVNINRILDKLLQKSKLESHSKELRKANPEHFITRKWSYTHHIDALQLLAFLKAKLYEEEPIILYNYFGMHKRSVELLRLIRDKEHHKFVQYFTSAYMPDESFISNIVILTHHVAQGSAQSACAMGLSSDGTGIVSRIVMSVGDVMREYLKKNGDVACKELRVFCRNKKAIQDDVAHDKGKSADLVYSWLSLEDVLGPKRVASLMTGIPIA
uniref:Acetyl-CoA hydrolase n=1 Tax=Talaromyces marneffei PM1 TaxID=1077442 RepID=A0A093V3L9_TALMA